MGFFSNLFDKIRMVNTQTTQIRPQNYIFGTIISGTYAQYKTDPNPTIFCLGCYTFNSQRYIHGIQMHALGANLQWMIDLIRNMKLNGTVTNPMLFFNYLKMNNPSIITNCYRTYFIQFSDFKTVHPGITNTPKEYCVAPTDQRDGFLSSLDVNRVDIFKTKVYNNAEKLKENIIAALNMQKLYGNRGGENNNGL